jgi:hypothetical protein
MQFPSSTGTATLLHNDTVVTLPYGAGHYGGTYCLNPGTGLMVDLPDYEARFDVYYHSSDDGDRYYDAVHVLHDSSAAEAPRILAPDALQAKAQPHIMALMQKVLDDEMVGSDLIFAIRTLNSPTWMHAAWVKAGRDIDKALTNVMRDVFFS